MWLLLLLSVAGCDQEAAPTDSRLRVAEALRDQGQGQDGFAIADRPREFRFPNDHGPHPAYRSEWWYWTGNLESDEGRRFGFHFTIFRTGLKAQPERPSGPVSEFRSSEIYMAHFAVVDVATGRVFDDERFVRSAAGLAGASAAPFRVFVEDWQASDREDTERPGEQIQLVGSQESETGSIGLDLALDAVRDIVLQGDRGLSRKSSKSDAASYYYSIPRMTARGRVAIDGETFDVEGTAWFDREWSTSALDRDQVGWDWFALQLEDGRELMFYRLRLADGSMDPVSSGVLVSPSGVRRLTAGEVELSVDRTWTSERTDARYPVGWRLAIPGLDLDLRVDALVDDQELDLSFRYWEGAVEVSGSERGVGYLEMTGYADR